MKAFKKLRRKTQKFLYKEQYSLILHDKRTGEEAHIRPPSLECIWADPFPAERDGLLYLFIEQEFSRQKGEIGYITVAPDMAHSDFRSVLKKPYHLSYPHLYECGGNLYMIPETNENNSIDCYICASFPDKWEFCTTLISGICAVDTDIVFHDGLFFLVTNAALGPGDGFNRKAFVYYAERFPSSEWKAHSENPVADSLASSRNAGRIACKEGKLYRPTQDCAAFYGRAVRIMQIEELTPQSWREREASLIEAPARWNARGYKAIGTHTYNESENYIVSDIKTRTRRFL